jgi:hypothetical protein
VPVTLRVGVAGADSERVGVDAAVPDGVKVMDGVTAAVVDADAVPDAVLEPVGALVRVVDGVIRPGDVVKFMATNRPYEVKEVGIFSATHPKFVQQPELSAGSVGYVIANIKTSTEVKVGDTLINNRLQATEPLPGFQEIQPMVFSGIYPINTADFEHLKTAMGKLQLNDAAFVFQAESSVALGFGFRLGGVFKLAAARGKLHVDVAFWGGLVPHNAENTTELGALLDAGVVGLKAFMSPSGIDDFERTTPAHLAARAACTLSSAQRQALARWGS